MGNAQAHIRTSGALDSFVSELGPDVVYERRYASRAADATQASQSIQLRFGALSEDSQVST